MAEPLKNSFGAEVVEGIGDDIAAVHAKFDVDRFLTLALDGFEELELTPRAHQIADALAETLPDDRTRAMRILQSSFGPPLSVEADGLTGPDTGGAMDRFRYLPHGYFVAEHGRDDFATAMTFQEELTKRFTAEFSIRTFFEHFPEETLAQARAWTGDANEHVRRLASEGSRTRLPWASRLHRFIDDPTEVIELLELLRNDSSEYVRRSVANNLNDIAKDHPEVVVDVTRRWQREVAGTDEEANRTPMVRHALRSLIKSGHLGALDVLGFGPRSPAELASVSVTPNVVSIGGKVRVEFAVGNPSDAPAGALADIVVHFVKADGSRSPKVFKGRELVLESGESSTVVKTISLAQHTTRKHYPGEHRVEIQLNGSILPGQPFSVVDGSD